MSSPGQKQGTCGHVMAMFDGHLMCAHCKDKGVGDDPCVQKKDCPICKAFTAEQVQQLATLTYRTRKEKEQNKTVAAPLVTSTTPPLWTLQKLNCWVGRGR